MIKRILLLPFYLLVGYIAMSLAAFLGMISFLKFRF